MSASLQTNERRGVMMRRLILGVAVVFAIGAWIGVGVVYLTRPSIAVWTIAVTIAALSLEVLMWTAAGVFGWSFLAKRRAMLQRLFGKRRDAGSDAET